jgi:putative methyltransferase
MNTYAAFVRTLHNASLTRLIAIYLRFTHGVPYQEFYEGVVEEFCPNIEFTASWQRNLVRHYQNYLVNDEAVDFMPVEEVPGYDLWLEPPRWLLVQLCLEHQSFFDSFTTFLLERYPDARNLAGAIDYQRNLVILPSYDRSVGKTFPISCDWVAYFENASRLTTVEPLPEPAPSLGYVAEVSDTTCTDDARTYPLDWESLPQSERWPVWIARTVVGHTGSSERRCNFQQLRVRAASSVA